MSPAKIKKDGREVLTPALWKKRRWELYVQAVKGGGVCFRCGISLEFNNVLGTESGGHSDSNFHAHHSQGRGLGGGKRDDRIYIPGEFDKSLWDTYPYMPEPPAGMKWNLYALCNVCHQRDEHGQDFTGGELHWSGSNGSREKDTSGSGEQDNLFEIDQADAIADRAARRPTSINR